MKKIAVIWLIGILSCSLIRWDSSVYAAESGKVIGSPELAVLVDGRKVKFQGGNPFMEHQRVQVPLRGIGEALGAKISFAGKTVTYEKNGKSIKLTLGSKTAAVDGRSVTMDTAAKAIKGRTYVPLRFISENLGEKVEWDQVGQWVWIGSKDVPSTDDDRFKMQKLSDFREYYEKTPWLLNNISDVPYEGIKTFNTSQLPLQMGSDFIVYDMYLVKIYNKAYIAIRSNKNGSPIYHLVADAYTKYRRDVHNGGTIHGDETITNYYPIIDNGDSFKNGVRTGVNWENYKLNTADYIAIDAIFPENYIVAFHNPFK